MGGYLGSVGNGFQNQENLTNERDSSTGNPTLEQFSRAQTGLNPRWEFDPAIMTDGISIPQSYVYIQHFQYSGSEDENQYNGCGQVTWAWYQTSGGVGRTRLTIAASFSQTTTNGVDTLPQSFCNVVESINPGSGVIVSLNLGGFGVSIDARFDDFYMLINSDIGTFASSTMVSPTPLKPFGT